jgi:hypothetical protein
MIAQPAAFRYEQGLGILQLVTSDQDTFCCIPAEQAIREKQLEVKESSESGSVNTLMVYNFSKEFIFFLDGDILAGAKQNRVVNTSILLAPESKTPIPVSCVEQGRWGYRSRIFTGTPYAAPPDLRAAKARDVSRSLKMKQGFHADQGEVWSRVAKYERLYQHSSETSNLSDVYEARMKELDALAASFTAADNANGLAVFVGRTLTAIDIFNGKELYRHYFPRILKGVVFGERGKTTEMLSEAEARFKALDLLDLLESAPCEEYPGAGVGTDCRRELHDVDASELRYQGHLIHAGVFRGTTETRTSRADGGE